MLDKRALSLPEKLISRFHTRDPFALARELGITVMLRHNFQRQKGAFCIIDRCGFIFINGNLSDELQRLICAHELGHALLHREIALSGRALLEFELLNVTDQCEYEANAFAAALLLDERELRDHLTAGEDVQAIARAMNVHVDLLLLRLETLKHQAARPLPRTSSRRFLSAIGDNAGSL